MDVERVSGSVRPWSCPHGQWLGLAHNVGVDVSRVCVAAPSRWPGTRSEWIPAVDLRICGAVQCSPRAGPRASICGWGARQAAGHCVPAAPGRAGGGPPESRGRRTARASGRRAGRGGEALADGERPAQGQQPPSPADPASPREPVADSPGRATRKRSASRGCSSLLSTAVCSAS